MPSSDKDPITMGRRFLSFCFSLFLGIAVLWLAVRLLSQFWGWLVVLAVVGAAGWVTVLVIRRRRNRW
jgi:uncharacterized membrane protein